MPKFVDLTGLKFGRLTVIGRAANDKFGRSKWLCRCNCGKETIVAGFNLKNGNIKSCGCLRKEQSCLNGKIYSTTHGKSKTKTYKVWECMNQRCNNTRHRQHKDYGGRNPPITVCKRWYNKNSKGFQNFLDDMGKCPGKGYSIDRIDNNKGYYKENCKWSTSKEQNRNTRFNRLITYNGKTQCLSAWAEEYNMSHQTLASRLDKLKWSIEKALMTPVGKRERKK